MKVLMVATVLLFFLSASAQQKVSLSTQRIYPGDKVNLQFQLQSPTDSLVLVDSLKPAMLLSSARNANQQTLTITSYDTGVLKLPVIQSASGLVFSSDTIRVMTLPSDSLKGYAELKTAFPPARENNTVFIIALALTILFIAYLVYRFIKNRYSNKVGQQIDAMSRPERWQKEMKVLQQNWQAQQVLSYEAADKLLLLMRALLHAGGKNTSHLTPREAIGQASNYFNASQNKQLQSAVEQCYLMLFAKHEPATDDFSLELKATELSGMEFFKNGIKS